MIVRPAALGLLVITSAGCLADEPGTSPMPVTSPSAPPPSATSPSATTPAPLLGEDGDTADVVVTVGAAEEIVVEVADDSDERRVGLMGRPEVPPGTGMLFLYPEPEQRSFWMGNVEVPLSIAWVRDGRVVGTAEMTPCPAADSSCPRYSAGVPIDAAVETTGGTFTQAGVEVGDTVTVSLR